MYPKALPLCLPFCAYNCLTDICERLPCATLCVPCVLSKGPLFRPNMSMLGVDAVKTFKTHARPGPITVSYYEILDGDMDSQLNPSSRTLQGTGVESFQEFVNMHDVDA